MCKCALESYRSVESYCFRNFFLEVDRTVPDLQFFSELPVLTDSVRFLKIRFSLAFQVALEFHLIFAISEALELSSDLIVNVLILSKTCVCRWQLWATSPSTRRDS